MRFAIILAIVCPMFVVAQPTKKELNPPSKFQAEILSELKKIDARWAELPKIKNALARKEAQDELAKDEKAWCEKVKKEIAANGITDWVGYAKFYDEGSGVYFCSDPDEKSGIRIYLTTKGASDVAKKTLKQIPFSEANPNHVRFSAAAYEDTYFHRPTPECLNVILTNATLKKCEEFTGK
jgi:hypothetical protein